MAGPGQSCAVQLGFDGDDGFGCAVRSPYGEQQFPWIRSGLEHAPWVATRQSSESCLPDLRLEV